MIDVKAVKEKEKADIKIEDIIRLINTTLMLFKEHYGKFGGASQEILKLKTFETTLAQLNIAYQKEYKFFEDNVPLSSGNEKNIELQILTELRGIILNLKAYAQQLNKIVDSASNDGSITEAYNNLIDEYNKYISKQKDLLFLMGTLERAR